MVFGKCKKNFENFADHHQLINVPTSEAAFALGNRPHLLLIIRISQIYRSKHALYALSLFKRARPHRFRRTRCSPVTY
jgi:hypothetical protein